MANDSSKPTPILGTGVARLLNSSKGILGLPAIAMAGYMATKGTISPKEAFEFVLWVIGILAGATAVEDGAKKFGAARAEAKSVQLIDMLSRVERLSEEVKSLRTDDEDDEDEEE